MQAKRDASFAPTLLIVFLTALLVSTPYLFRFYKGEYMYANDYQELAEKVLLAPKFILISVNLLLMFQLNNHLSIRWYMKLKFLTMLDP